MLSATFVAYWRGNIYNFCRTQPSGAGGSARGEGAGSGDSVRELGGVPYDVLGQRPMRSVLPPPEMDAPCTQREAEQPEPGDTRRDHPRQLERNVDGARHAVPSPREHPERRQREQREHADDLYPGVGERRDPRRDADRDATARVRRRGRAHWSSERCSSCSASASVPICRPRAAPSCRRALTLMTTRPVMTRPSPGNPAETT